MFINHNIIIFRVLLINGLNYNFQGYDISPNSLTLQPASLPEPHYTERTEHYPPPTPQYVDRSYAASLAASHSDQAPAPNYPDYE